MLKKYLNTLISITFVFLSFNDYSEAAELPKKIAITAAMDCEMQYISDNLKRVKHEKFANIEIQRGKLGKYDVILSKSGIGKVNAGIITQFITDKYKPGLIINTGLAGGLEKGMKKGDIIIGEKMIQHDFDISVFGYAKGYTGNGVKPDEPTVFTSDEKAVETLQKAIPDAKTGTIASGDAFIADKAKKAEIKKEFNASAVDMESAAIAQCANLNNVPVVIIRMISDSTDDTAGDYDNDEEKYAQKSAKMLVEILKEQ